MKLLTPELLAKLENLRIPSRRRFPSRSHGERPGTRKGTSIEFSDYREYLQGDDIRSVDWNVYARTERLFLKLFLEEQSKPVFFLVDASGSMNFGNPTKFEYALALSAACSYATLRSYDHPSVIVLKDRSIARFRFRSQRDFFAVVKELEKQQPIGPSNLNGMLRRIASSKPVRGVYFILSDFYSDDGLESLKKLAASGNELHLIHILTREEIAPSLRGDLRLIDSESEETSEVSISPASLKKYHARLQTLQHELKRLALTCEGTYHLVQPDKPLASLLLKDLRKAGIVA